MSMNIYKRSYLV